MSDDIDAIVRGLSKAQREAWRQSGTLVVLFASRRDRDSAVGDDLAVDNWKAKSMEIDGETLYGATPTPRGIAARDRIMAQKGGDV